MARNGCAPGCAGVVACAALLLPSTAAAQDLAPIPALDTARRRHHGTLDAAARAAAARRRRWRCSSARAASCRCWWCRARSPKTSSSTRCACSSSGSSGARAWTTACCWWSPRTTAGCASRSATGWKARSPMRPPSRVIQEYLVPQVPRRATTPAASSDATAVLVKLVDGEPLPAPMAEPRASAEATGAAATGCSRCSPPSSWRSSRARMFGRAPRALRGSARRRGRGRHRLAAVVRCAGRRASAA